jgi:Kef-type K+ transport system membrane component KefB
VVLTTAMIEDMALWVMLSVTLGLASVETASPFAIARGILVTMGYFAFCQVLGHRIYDGISRARWNPFKTAADGMPVLLVFMVTVLLAYLLGVNPIFGAFLAGRVVASSERIAAATRDQIKGFSFAFFIPAYFASVGLQLDLRHDFDLGLFGGILLGACAIKAASVYLGARLAAQPHATSIDLAIAMNARGGPGIVLATVALNAGLISGAFQAILILLSLVTSQIAGWWLQRPSVRDALVREAHGREAPVT